MRPGFDNYGQCTNGSAGSATVLKHSIAGHRRLMFSIILRAIEEVNSLRKRVLIALFTYDVIKKTSKEFNNG